MFDTVGRNNRFYDNITGSIHTNGFGGNCSTMPRTMGIAVPVTGCVKIETIRRAIDVGKNR